VTGFREAAGFEGLIVLAIVYFILSRLQQAGKRAAQARQQSQRPPLEAPPGGTPTQQEGLSLESILREIERVKQQREQPPRPAPLPRRTLPQPTPSRRLPAARKPEVVQDERGPMGRMARAQLESAEDFEERTSLEETGAVARPRRPQLEDEVVRGGRVIVDQDAEAEGVVESRIRAAEARNRPHAGRDHAEFDQKIREAAAPAQPAARYDTTRLRDAFVWREILGPPKALE
jgi:hypothetical protein